MYFMQTCQNLTGCADGRDLLVALNRTEGLTVVMVTHEEDMAAYARRLVVFTDGRILRDEPVAVEA